MSETLEVTIKVPVQFLKDQVGGADIGYWAYSYAFRNGPGELPTSVFEYPCEDEAVRVMEDSLCPEEACTEHRLNWHQAVQVAVEKFPRLLDPNNMDASTGDLWVQLAAFGEVIFG